ncbi:uncharacterized protein LOC129578687 isoform X1 [Sitodiplosis mosellana]|uniref:uncharacterized protein LOC129578687 isoform X1 n=1 Tax=Sitodiplosis mosellana TaxID=263140 RepID=UPI0024437935|nr:uncharacterized protein LOC129578687 isoform X1 [Sitodiplosis mosellana]
MKLMIACVCVPFLAVACSAGNLLSTDHLSLQSILATRSDSVNTNYLQQLVHPPLNPSVQSPVTTVFLPQSDHINAQLSQQWQDEANWAAAYQPSFSSSASSLSHLPLQHWTNEQFTLAALAHNPLTTSLLSQYNDINAKFIPTLPGEQLHTRSIQFAYAPVTTSLLQQHEHSKYSQHWPTEQLHALPLESLIHASPTTVVTQPYAVEKPVPIFVPVPVDHHHSVAKPYPVYVHKQPHNSWTPPQFQLKRHTTHQNGNPNGIIIRKRTHLKN